MFNQFGRVHDVIVGPDGYLYVTLQLPGQVAVAVDARHGRAAGAGEEVTVTVGGSDEAPRPDRLARPRRCRHAAPAAAGAASTKPLQIYVVDTEGGKATLFVSPTGQTVLIDSGNPGGRDTDRIMAGHRRAGVTKIDYLITTHYHVDHVGGMQELAKRIPIGDVRRSRADASRSASRSRASRQAYAELYGKAKHIVAKPGDQHADHRRSTGAS